MFHLMLNQDSKSNLTTKQICELNDVLRKRNQIPDETKFGCSHRGKPEDFQMLAEVRKRRQAFKDLLNYTKTLEHPEEMLKKHNIQTESENGPVLSKRLIKK